MRYLFKYATRGRPEWFQSTLKEWVNKLSMLHSYKFIFSIDEDDWQMQNPLVKMGTFLLDHERQDKIEFLFFTGKRTTKIDAINRDMEHAGEFDTLVVISDDMIPVCDWYDDIIAKDMQEHFPGYDGALHYPDGFAGKELITCSIFGQALYKKLGHIYYPGYKSLWCDNEFTDRVKAMGKYKLIDKTVIKHEWKKHGSDELYNKNEADYHRDRAIYEKRKKEGFPE